MKGEVNIETQGLAIEIAQEVIKSIKPMLTRNTLESDSILDIKELAKYLKVKPKWIYQQTHLNTIPFLKLGNQLRFKKKDIDKWIDTLNKPVTGLMSAPLRVIR